MACLSFASSTDHPQFLATVVFYSDGKFYKEVAAGRVLPMVKMLIRKAVTRRVKGALVNVVPIFKTIGNIPPPKDMLRYLNKKFKSLYTVNLPEIVAYRIVKQNDKYQKQKSGPSSIRMIKFKVLFAIEKICNRNEDDCSPKLPKEIHELTTISIKHLFKLTATSTTPYAPR